MSLGGGGGGVVFRTAGRAAEGSRRSFRRSSLLFPSSNKSEPPGALLLLPCNPLCWPGIYFRFLLLLCLFPSGLFFRVFPISSCSSCSPFHECSFQSTFFVEPNKLFTAPTRVVGTPVEIWVNRPTDRPTDRLTDQSFDGLTDQSILMRVCLLVCLFVFFWGGRGKGRWARGGL